MKMDNKTKEIQMSVAFNNASRIMAGNLAGINREDIESEEIANGVDELARDLYAKQIKFLKEILEQKDGA